MLMRPCASLQQQPAPRTLLHASVVPDHAALASRNGGTRAWASIVSITLGDVTPGSDLAGAVESYPMPREKTFVTGTAAPAAEMLAPNPADFPFLWGCSKHVAAPGGSVLLGHHQHACCGTAYSQTKRSPPDRTAVIASDRSTASRPAAVACLSLQGEKSVHTDGGGESAVTRWGICRSELPR